MEWDICCRSTLTRKGLNSVYTLLILSIKTYQNYRLKVLPLLWTHASPAVLKMGQLLKTLLRSHCGKSNRTILTAAGISQVASWDEESKHGLFTRYFLDGVYGNADRDVFGDNDGKVTLAELKKYLEEEVTYYARRKYGRDQNPQIVGTPSTVLAEISLN